MSLQLPAGKWKTVRLRNLPKDAVMAIVVNATRSITVSLLSEADYRRFPRLQDPIFLGSVERRLSFTVTIPATGTYYFVLDNRRSEEPCKVKFLIRAQRAKKPPEGGTPPRAPSKESET